MRGSKLNTVFEMRPHQCRVQEHDHFPTLPGHTMSDTSQDAVGFLGHLGTQVGHLVIEGDQVGQAGPAFHERMLPGLDPLVGLHMPVEHTQDHRITESQNRIGWKRPLRSSSPAVNVTLPRSPLYHVPKHLIQTSFKYFQGWRLNHFPGQPVPMLDNPFSEVKFPNTQSKPPLAQLEAISSCPITCYLGEETDPHLSTTSYQVVVESKKVSPQPPFLQAKQPQFPQPLLMRLGL
ncbi:hypothetical protein QYF61_019489 [Mycteria americana]|uniref:Uncharacterized protein n=1 Tax=Mycteria americana TaxID=33587 RepID=A0AAN7P6S4_MYCAM|nr:hypothetical protein QYF61_019489 [Mycteria americana]